MDGFDIDYENPQFSSTESFERVSKAIRTELGNDFLFTITPNNTLNLSREGLNNNFDYVNVQCYDARGDACCPISIFTEGGLNVDKSRLLAGVDIERGEQVENAIKKMDENNLAGVFAWQLANDFSTTADKMWRATHNRAN